MESEGGDAAYISHAHSDHASYGKKAEKIICSEETAVLIGSSKERLNLENAKLLDAGHMLGSTQLSAQVEGGKFVYTGDFKLEAGITTKGAEMPKECDYLLIEGTYGEPGAVFPKREEVFAQMQKWVMQNKEKTIVFGAYETGKAQEMIGFLNKYCGVAPVVSKKIDDVCKIYGKFGVKLERVRAGTHEAEEMCMGGGFTAVLPVREANEGLCRKLSGVYGKEALCALATGWGYKRSFSAGKVFCLSDHADFNGIIEYVNGANPKKIYCTHGNEKTLARELRARGFDAAPLVKKEEGGVQTTLEMAPKGVAVQCSAQCGQR
ncbi:hypothetical protein AUJ17_00095 [Candidatus Micrarchaeota archaeon CG1_02_47_40]|nr:MAG: hypothetical protein AUJ17_00095 [Candidatus Micrarchaeota archaeon CG1_02_47_40]